MTQNKMAAVREVLSANPDAKPKDIVQALAQQKIHISEGVASNYKSVIRSKAKRGRRKQVKVAAAAPVAAPVAPAASNGKSHSLDPALVSLLQAGKSLGWDKVMSIAELMTEK